jgi:RNase H-fold protein (predicted Holliday junction resolvase)
MSWLPSTALALPVYLALDAGSVRCGLAIAPASTSGGGGLPASAPAIAVPLGVVPTEPQTGLARRVLELLGPRVPVLLIAGLPLDKRGQDGPAAELARKLATVLADGLAALLRRQGSRTNEGPLPVEFIDERFSTAAALSARRGLYEAKQDARRAAAQRENRREHIPAMKLREHIDAQVAAELLQGWLDSRGLPAC